MNWTIVWIALGSTLLSLVVLLSPLGRGIISRLQQFVSSASGSVVRATLTIGLVGAVLGAMPSLFRGIAPPSVHDEFAYLLMGDTFSRLRLTNERHAHYASFEALHVLNTPTYQGKYPPAQGLLLAIGFRLGHPLIGAILGVTLGAVAVMWLLRSVVDHRWAFVGGLFTVTHPLVWWWGQSYWGGGAALIGGAIVAGATIRLTRFPTPFNGFMLGGGLGWLAITRPFEGAVLGLICGLYLLVMAVRSRQVGALLKRSFLPGAIALGAWLAFLGYYNHRVVGDATKMPYVFYAEKYQIAPLFLWQDRRPMKTYTDDAMKMYWAGTDLDEWTRQRSPRGWWSNANHKIAELLTEHLRGWVMILAIPGVVMTLRRRPETRLLGLVCVLFPVIHVSTATFFRPHYSGVMTASMLSLLIVGVSGMSRWTVGARRVGLAAAGAILIGQFAVTVSDLIAAARNTTPPGSARQGIIDRLQTIPGRDLILVRYLPGEHLMFDWCYNLAEIDSQDVVWARSVSQEADANVIRYFRDRMVWRLNVRNQQWEFVDAMEEARTVRARETRESSR